VEDTVVVAGKSIVLTSPGAESRRGEIREIESVLRDYFDGIQSIYLPGTLDGGDICEADGHFFIGISERTNLNGAQQLKNLLAQEGYPSTLVDVGSLCIPNLLHLKSGIAYIGDHQMVLCPELAELDAFAKYEKIVVSPKERYAANCVRVNDYVLIADGFPMLNDSLQCAGFQTIALEMTEYQKMDGGLSCLSIRF
jgi:dimethylargininase